MRARHSAPLFSIIALTLLPSLGHGQVYSWKDASGKVHYGDRPPMERQVDSRKLPPPPVATDDVQAARKASAERQLEEREKQGKGQEVAKKEDPAQAKQREENCRRAKARVAYIESGQARFTIDDKGERVALDGSVREAELSSARKAADDWCKPPAAAK